MFSKILIANRGEIACRIIRSARAMGIATVAVHSDADADAPHVEMADEAVRIGPAPSSESYLVIDNILRAARETGADAVHPGYGFLAENAGFAEALEAAGITFIGPGLRAIAAMGDKIESKRLAAAAGVSTIPGQDGAVADAEAALAAARAIGYPVMLKASAGGGGKGMRVAGDDAAVREGFAAAAREARSSFGDDRIFVEKFIEQPRHIEIQVLADAHGNAVHLGERECSIQRRHQKIIEEAPSSFLDAETRAAMGAQAVALARAVDYRSAGTVEFIVDRDRNFYFLEMNTRLQVEHPVTECVTGIDLVAEMIRIAAGEELRFAQDDVSLDGWAIEARIYAEDPFRNFLPSTGRLVHYRAPLEEDGIRVDSGVVEGSEISIYYDPMIAKLIAAAPSRAEAIARMRAALDAYYIRGVSHNIPFLAAVLAHPRFAAGDISTAFIDETYPDGFGPADMVHEDPHLPVAVAAFIHCRLADRAARLGGGDAGAGEAAPSGGDFVAVSGGGAGCEGVEYKVRASREGAKFIVRVDDSDFTVESDWRPGAPLFRGTVNGARVCMQVEPRGARVRLSHAGGQVDILMVRARVAALNRLMPHKAPPDTSRFLLSPMPGLLIRLAVAAGDVVKAGEELAVVEAMKMENVLRAERDGTIAELIAAEGDSLAVDQPILAFE